MQSPAGAEEFEQHTVARGGELLAGRTFWNVNSTAHGGGLAEMLRSLIGYVRGTGLDARWVTSRATRTSSASPSLHNRLHGFAGDGGPLRDAEHAPAAFAMASRP